MQKLNRWININSIKCILTRPLCKKNDNVFHFVEIRLNAKKDRFIFRKRIEGSVKTNIYLKPWGST